jgi:hypothetical protein
VGQQVHQIVAQLLEAGVRFIRDKHSPQFMNEGLARKSKAGRQNKTKKHFGTARTEYSYTELRTVEGALRKEQQAMNEERRAALRGLL